MTRVNREAPIQRAVVDYLRLVMPPACIVLHSAHEGVRGGKRGALDGARAKSMGQVSGFPDVVCVTYRGVLFFEVKAEGGRMSEAQKDIRGRIEAMGHRSAVVRSVDDVREALSEWSFPTRHVEGVG